MSLWPYRPPRSWYDQTTAALATIQRQLGQVVMSQERIEADVTSIGAVLDGVAADQGELLTDAQAIQQELANTGTVSTASLDALVDRAQGIKTALDTATASVNALVTTPTPDPGPTP